MYQKTSIEERLMSVGVQNKIKREKQAQSKETESIQLANHLHVKRERNTTMNTTT